MLTWLADSDSTADVTVRDQRSSKAAFSARLEGVLARRWHPAEYRNGHLYAIRRIGNPRSPVQAWTDELWRYRGQEPRTRLFAGKGLSFRVAPNESVIVVRGGDEPGRGLVTLLSAEGSVIRAFGAPDLHLDDIGDLWATNRYVFVSNGGPGAGFDRLARISTRDWTSTLHEFRELGIDADGDFDAERQLVIGSDHPFFYDAEDHDDWMKDKPVVTLRVYDLMTRSSTTIATSVAKRFEPRWVRDGVFEFTEPKSGKRVTRSARSPSGRPR
jgi:hypothetical protein